MVIDYVTGDYKDIKIENVESWHGEANGLTIYKESYINLQSVLIRNINAGTKLDKETAESLTLPNIIPRACAVDIHDDTIITFVDGEDIDNIRFENVMGYDTCQQFKDINNNNNNNQNTFPFHNYQHIYMNVVLSIFGAILMAMIGYVIYRITDKLHKERKGGIIDEITPLLKSI